MRISCMMERRSKEKRRLQMQPPLLSNYSEAIRKINLKKYE